MEFDTTAIVSISLPPGTPFYSSGQGSFEPALAIDPSVMRTTCLGATHLCPFQGFLTSLTKDFAESSLGDLLKDLQFHQAL